MFVCDKEPEGAWEGGALFRGVVFSPAAVRQMVNHQMVNRFQPKYCLRAFRPGFCLNL